MATEIQVNIGSGNGLLPDSTKPLPEPMLTHHHQGRVTFIGGHYLEKIWRCQSVKQDWKLHYRIAFRSPRGQWVKCCYSRLFSMFHTLPICSTMNQFTSQACRGHKISIRNDFEIIWSQGSYSKIASKLSFVDHSRRHLWIRCLIYQQISLRDTAHFPGIYQLQSCTSPDISFDIACKTQRYIELLSQPQVEANPIPARTNLRT